PPPRISPASPGWYRRVIHDANAGADRKNKGKNRLDYPQRATTFLIGIDPSLESALETARGLAPRGSVNRISQLPKCGVARCFSAPLGIGCFIGERIAVVAGAPR